MAISVSESGLTQDQYEALQARFDAYSYQVIVERQNLVFESFSVGAGGAGPQLDSIIINGYLFRSIVNKVERMDLSTGGFTDVSPSAPSGLTNNSTYSLAGSTGTSLYVFAATATGVQMNSTADNGGTWAGWTTIWSTSDQTIYTGNVARDGTASASSHYSSSTADYPASNAFDRQSI